MLQFWNDMMVVKDDREWIDPSTEKCANPINLNKQMCPGAKTCGTRYTHLMWILFILKLSENNSNSDVCLIEDHLLEDPNCWSNSCTLKMGICFPSWTDGGAVHYSYCVGYQDDSISVYLWMWGHAEVNLFLLILHAGLLCQQITIMKGYFHF